MGITTGPAIGLGLLGAASSVGGAAIAGHEANKAATTQATAATSAAQLQKQSADESLAFQKQQYADQQKLQAPWIQSGTDALSKLNSSTPFQAPGADFTQDPGYQFRVSQGQKAIENSAAARGGVLSGGTVKGVEDYAQGSASQEYGNAYNRSLTTYNTNQNALLSRAGLGQNATNSLSGEAGATGVGVGNTLLQSGNQQAAGINNAGAARASGYAAAGNIFGAVPGQIGTDVNQALLYSQLMKQRPQYNPNSVGI